MVLIGALLFLWIAGTLLWGRLDSFVEVRASALSRDVATRQLNRGLDG